MASNQKTQYSNRTTTLTSLAILTVDINEGNRDYLDYLATFVIEGLALRRPEVVTDELVVQVLAEEFGLRIPRKAVQHVIRRLTKRRGLLEYRDGGYFVTAKLPEPRLNERRKDASEHIRLVIAQLCEFSKSLGIEAGWTSDQAIAALTSFLGNFAIDCLKAHVFNTVLPSVPESGAQEHFVVSRFLRDAYSNNRPLFDSFIVLVKGQMYANALTCPDLESLEQKFRTLTCYLDTPVVLNLLGLHGPAYQAAARELVDLVSRLTGNLAVFHHTFEEVVGVLRFCITNYDNAKVTNRALRQAREGGISLADLILLEGHLETRLRELKVRVHDTPPYKEEYQIDEVAFRDALRDEVAYLGETALSHDVNSVRSIYVRRKGTSPTRLENAVAVLVTSNSAFAKAAFEQGKLHNSSREVSPVITDYSLANVAWLKSPLAKPLLPEHETLALCYAGMEPSRPLVEKYVRTMETMRASGTISEDDHAILRASHIAQSELMNLTLGDDDALTEQSISKILERTKHALVADITRTHGEEISRRDAKQIELEKLLEEQRAAAERDRAERERQAAAERDRLEAALREEQAKNSSERQHQQRLAERWATFVMAVPAALLTTVLLIGSIFSTGLIELEVVSKHAGVRTGTSVVVFATTMFGFWTAITGGSLGGLLRRPRDRLAARILRVLRRDNR